jgi:hypothetical protein
VADAMQNSKTLGETKEILHEDVNDYAETAEVVKKRRNARE